MLVGLAVVDVTTYLLVKRSQLQQVDDELQRAHTPTEALALDERSWDLIPELTPGLYVAIFDQQGRLAFEAQVRTRDDSHEQIDLGRVDFRTRYQTIGDGEDSTRIRSDRLDNGSTLLFGRSLHDQVETQRQLLFVLLAASGAAIAATIALSWRLIGVSLRPLHDVEVSAAAITDSGLSDQRVAITAQNDEVANLAVTLNKMLDRLDVARLEREQTVTELQASERRMRQFVADASHELRTPLAATAAYAELFEAGARDRPADLDRSMRGIRSETSRMASLIDDLLLLAQLDEQRPLANEAVDLTAIVLAALDAARTMDPSRTFTPIIKDVVTVSGDPDRLRQVIDNLLSNVRKHTPATTRCTISLALADGDAILTVRDEGDGVTDDQLDKLGNRFYRVDHSRARASGGAGLGLSIANAIVRSHQGTLQVSHTDPHGLTVTISLPNAELLGS